MIETGRSVRESEVVREFEISEVHEAPKNLKSKNAPGFDGIHKKFLLTVALTPRNG